MSQTELEKNLEGIIDVFHRYSIQKEPYDMLSKAEFAKLMKEQLPNFIQGSNRVEATDSLFKELDLNVDRMVSLNEFLDLVARTLVRAYDRFHQDD